ncbi:MAG TPA: hypothetical protein VGI04_03465, partial [Neobacillus sp.]
IHANASLEVFIYAWWLVVIITYALRIKLNGTSADKSKLNREWTKQSLLDFFFLGKFPSFLSVLGMSEN